MKNSICSALYDWMYKMDKVEKYDYETAPYCGHHYSGHRGKRTMSHYHEGFGHCEAKIGCLWLHKNSEENDWDWRIIVWKDAPIVWHRSNGYGGVTRVNFWGFIGFRRGFINKWWDGLIPFKGGKGAWHFLGFRFTKGDIYPWSSGLTAYEVKLINKCKSNN